MTATADLQPARRWRAAGLAVVAGLAAAAGQAPLGWWWLALAGHTLLCWLVAGAARPALAFRLAWLGGAVHFGAALSWIVEPFLVDIARHGWMAPFAVLLMAGGLALFWGGAGWLAARLCQGRAGRALAFAGLLTLAEWLRGVVFTGFPWALAGHVWIDTPVVQLAAVTGPDGLSLLLLLAAALPVAMGRAGLPVSAMLVAGVWAWGTSRMAEPVPPRASPVMVRLVQPDAEQTVKWDASLARQHFDTLLDLTRRPAAASPDLVIWPETSVPYLLDRASGALVEIAEAGGSAPVAIGIQRTDGDRRGWNSMAVIGPGGEVQALYDKHHLVPFGEYVPAGDFLARTFGIVAFAAQEGFGYSAGTGPQVIDLGARLGRFLPLICYEAVFPEDLRAAPGRADWIMQITNDAWFGTLTGPWQHLAQARLRAVEQGLPLARAANTGVSAMIDAHGRITAILTLGERGVLDAELPGALPATPYSRNGEWPVFVALALLIATGVALGRHRA